MVTAIVTGLKIGAVVAGYFGVRYVVRKAIVSRFGPGIIAAVEEGLRKFTFWLNEHIYPLISKFYDIFQDIGRHKFFSREDISKISNNIYIVISIIMIFALSIKLLNSIVNPDVLTEKKNGVTSLVKRLFISVALIIIIPWGFTELYELQDILLSKSIVQKMILSSTNLEGENGGDILAGYTLSSLIKPNYDLAAASDNSDFDVEVTANSINALFSVLSGDVTGSLDSVNNINTKYQLSECATKYYDMVKDPKNASNFSGCINLKLEASEYGAYAFEYSAIASLVIGIYLVYEMLLLCIDIALRTIKLGLLELITPIVVCGYIYNPDVLQRWFKEVITTFILIFIKIAVVMFVLLGISYIPNFLANKEYFADHRVWIQIFIIIGLLQLIKAIPALVNSLFGIKVKNQGGIKGRLGEMAGVGKIAQNAWGALGNKAKGLAKTAGIIPLSLMGNSIKKKFDKLSQKNTKAGHLAAKIKQAANGKLGSVAKTTWAGINSNGENTGKILKETWNKTSIGLRNREIEMKKQEEDYNNKFHLDKGRSRTNFGSFKFTDSKDKKRVVDKDGLITDDNGNILNLNSRFNADNIFVTDKDGKRINSNIIKSMKKADGESDEEFENRKNESSNLLYEAIIDAKRLYNESRKVIIEYDIELNSDYKNSTLDKLIQDDIIQYESIIKSKSKLSDAKSSYEDAMQKLKYYLELTKANTDINRKINNLLVSMGKASFTDLSYEEQKNMVISTGITGDYLDAILEDLSRFNSVKNEVSLSTYDLSSLQKEIDELDSKMSITNAKLDGAKSGNNISIESIREINNRINNINIKYAELAAQNAEIAFDNSDYGKQQYKIDSD